jgi:hypothetical protein
MGHLYHGKLLVISHGKLLNNQGVHIDYKTTHTFSGEIQSHHIYRSISVS